MVNINIEIPGELHKRLKLTAIQRDATLKEYIIAQLDERLRRRGR